MAAAPAGAAPLPPFRSVDLCGVLRSADWLPPLTLPAESQMSGSAGRERYWPGRFAVVLQQVTGIAPDTIQQINALLSTSRDGSAVTLGPGDLLLVLPHDDPQHLADAASLCVEDFAISGDEGGTWTRFETLWVTSRKSD